MKITAENTFKDLVLNKEFNLFLGAGFSILAKNKDNENLCLGEELKDSLIEFFDLQKYKDKDLSYISKKLKKTKNGEFYNYLTKKLKVIEYDNRYANLFKREIRNIISLNIDDLLEVLFTREIIKEKSLVDSKIYGITEDSGIMLFKIHGSVTYPADDDYYFSTEDISSFNFSNPQLFQALSLKIASLPTIFWGVNTENIIVQNFLTNAKKIKNLKIREKWIVVLPDEKYDEDALDLQDDGYNIIRATTDELLDYFSRLENDAGLDSSEEIVAKKDNVFEKYLIANIKKAKNPVRPITKFYEGDDALWSDIINNKIVKLSVYYDIMNSILNGENRHISGIPGSGKTTLLMQLACNLPKENIVYYFDSLQKNIAQKFSEFIGDKRCYVFMDNVADNLDALLLLKKNKNIIFVTAERDHKFEIIKQKVNISNNQCIDISDIKNSDVQKICNSMNKKGRIFETEKSSLFEIVYNISTNKKLGAKIHEMLQDLKSQTKDLYDLYIILTYMRYTNVFASLDTLMAYFTDLDFTDLYRNLNILRSSVNESQSQQEDFFSLRSRVFAEASIKNLPSNDVGQVIQNFLERVPFFCVNRYDIFKKKAYDADLTTIAFPCTEDGKFFYETLLSKDNSAFNKQQYALYLKRKNENDLAWNLIDEAFTQCDGRIYSIVNTHAMILFDNNIDKDEDSKETVKNTLKETFEVLKNCINRDDRKPYHVLTYAKHSVRYYNRYNDTLAYDYVKTANSYINLLKDVYVPKKARTELNLIKKDINSILNI